MPTTEAWNAAKAGEFCLTGTGEAMYTTHVKTKNSVQTFDGLFLAQLGTNPQLRIPVADPYSELTQENVATLERKLLGPNFHDRKSAIISLMARRNQRALELSSNHNPREVFPVRQSIGGLYMYTSSGEDHLEFVVDEARAFMDRSYFGLEPSVVQRYAARINDRYHPIHVDPANFAQWKEEATADFNLVRLF